MEPKLVPSSSSPLTTAIESMGPPQVPKNVGEPPGMLMRLTRPVWPPTRTFAARAVPAEATSAIRPTAVRVASVMGPPYLGRVAEVSCDSQMSAGPGGIARRWMGRGTGLRDGRRNASALVTKNWPLAAVLFCAQGPRIDASDEC